MKSCKKVKNTIIGTGPTGIEAHIQIGWGAITCQKDYRKLRVSVVAPCHSTDFDSAYQKIPGHSNQNRWDYMLCFETVSKGKRTWGSVFLAFLEIHPVDEDQVSVIIRKKDWMHQLVASQYSSLQEYSHQYYVLHHAKNGRRMSAVSISRNERRLASNRISLLRADEQIDPANP